MSVTLTSVGSPYGDTSDLIAVWGSDNIAKWADKNNNEDAGQIASALSSSSRRIDKRIDDYFRQSIYVVPLQPVDDIIIGWKTDLWAAELYRQRGLRDDGTDEVAGKLAHNENRAKKEMREYRSLLRIAEWTRNYIHPTSPVAF